MAVTKPFQTAICQMAHLLLLFPDYISLVGFFEDLFIPRLTYNSTQLFGNINST